MGGSEIARGERGVASRPGLLSLQYESAKIIFFPVASGHRNFILNICMDKAAGSRQMNARRRMGLLDECSQALP